MKDYYTISSFDTVSKVYPETATNEEHEDVDEYNFQNSCCAFGATVHHLQEVHKGRSHHQHWQHGSQKST